MAIFIVHNDSDKMNEFIEHGGFISSSSTDVLTPTRNDLIIQWGEGTHSNETNTGWVLNGERGLANSKDWNDILPAHGIQIAKQGMNIQKKYLVFVFHLEVLGLFTEQTEVWLSDTTKSNPRYREIPQNKNSLEYRQVKKLAIRSIHSLGLDFGMVVIGVSYKNQFVVQVSPKPILFKRMIHRLVNAVQTLEQNILSKIDPSEVMLGADPEFVLRKQNGKFVLASNYFSKNGSVGCDQIWLRGDKTKKKLPIVELRPNPSTEPITLVRNIYKRLLAASKKINDANIQFLAGSHPLRGYPIGGHIHFSNIHLNSFLLRALDNYLALPLFLLEDPNGFPRRPRYGFVGDYRLQYHGGFEYRALASWLVSPRITKGVIALAKLVVCSYPNLRRTSLSIPAIQAAFYQGDQAELLEIVQSLWQDIEDQPLYEKYRNYLDPFKDSIFKLERWDERADIRPRWRIMPYSKS